LENLENTASVGVLFREFREEATRAGAPALLSEKSEKTPRVAWGYDTNRVA